MPRTARKKSFDSIYHIMCRSVSEFLLFKDNDDKKYYLTLIERYLNKFKCSLYAYCLMDNHLHLQLDPLGCDVSKFMQGLNTAYAWYYNKKYIRHGPVFQDRFQSRILDTDEYNIAVSAYIHNNPGDIEGYSGKEETYPYSSYGIYLGIRKDSNNIIDKSFMMGLFGLKGEAFKKRYLEFVSHQRDIGSLTELKKKLEAKPEYEYISGRRIIKRDMPVSLAIEYISEKLIMHKKNTLAVKSKRRVMDYRAFTAYVLRVLCGLGYKDICRCMFNITVSGCSRLCTRGFELLEREESYKGLFEELVSGCA